MKLIDILGNVTSNENIFKNCVFTSNFVANVTAWKQGKEECRHLQAECPAQSSPPGMPAVPVQNAGLKIQNDTKGRRPAAQIGKRREKKFFIIK